MYASSSSSSGSQDAAPRVGSLPASASASLDASPYNVLSMEITLFQAASCEWFSMKQMSVKQKLDKVLKLFQFLKGTGLIGSRLGVGTGI